MPTEVTPIPFQMASSMGFHPGWSSMPGPGPARAAVLIPRNRAPGSVMPNGLRNPWAPYSGETYMPSAASAALRQENQIAGGTAYGGSVMGGSVMGGSVMGGGMGGMSVIAPSSVGLGGYREDDGWNGSMGRAHLGHAPDMSSTAGAISQIRGPSAGGWLNQPASWGNHARMTPTIAAGLAGSEIFSPPHPGPAPTYLQPPAHGHHRSSSMPGRRPRRGSMVQQVEEECAECVPHRSRSGGHGHRRLGSTPVPIGGSPMRKGREPLLGDGLGRSGSVRSRHSRGCSECDHH